MIGVRFSTSAALLGVIALTSASAAAQNEALGEALFRQGRELIEAGKLDEACEKFAESQAADAKVGTLLNLAVCHEKQGKLATAWAEFAAAASQAKAEGQEDREKAARKKVAELEGKYSTLTISADPAGTEGLQVTIDGVATTAFGTALPMDPGAHEVRATAPGREPWSQSVDIPKTKTAAQVTVPQLPLATTEDVFANDAAEEPSETDSATSDDDSEGSSGYLPLAIVGFSVAGVGAIVGGITGGIAFGEASSLDEMCANKVCAPEDESAIDDANTVANISNIAFIVGGVGAGVGIVGLILHAGSDSETSAANAGGVAVEPWIGAGVSGLRGRF